MSCAVIETTGAGAPIGLLTDQRRPWWRRLVG